MNSHFISCCNLGLTQGGARLGWRNLLITQHATILAHELPAEKSGRVKSSRSVATATLGLENKIPQR